MKDDRDYKLDLSSAAADAAARSEGDADAARPPSRPRSTPPPTARPFISVQFDCCNVYLRIYRSADGTAYRGRCPKCGKPVHFAVGQGGTDSRVFRVT
jgi:hypothetical protein